MKRRKRPHAFTLTEVIAALVILAVGIPPALWALREAALRRALPAQATVARWLAAERLEEIIADRHSPQRGYDHLAALNYPDEAALDEYPAFARSVAFSETGADLVSPGAGFMRATVQIAWTDAFGRPRELSLSTILTEYPP